MRLALACSIAAPSNLLRISIFVRPMRILDIRNLKEPIRIGATHPQSRADAFAVLLLALEADGLDFVFLLCFGTERSVVSVMGFGF
jgi:hypothetical protein